MRKSLNETLDEILDRMFAAGMAGDEEDDPASEDDEDDPNDDDEEEEDVADEGAAADPRTADRSARR